MAWKPLVALLLFAYTALVVWMNVVKPPKLWEMAKIKGFRKVLGETGAVVFFYIWAAAFAVVGVLLLTVWA